MPPAPLCPNRSRVINAHEGIFKSATSMHSRTTLAPSALGRDLVHVPWDCAMHGLLTPAAGLPRQLGVELSCHTHLCWEIKHCSGPPLHPQGPVQGWGLSALCQGSVGAKEYCSTVLWMGTRIWIAGKFTHPHQSAPASVNAALFHSFASKAKEQLGVNPAFQTLLQNLHKEVWSYSSKYTAVY